MSLFDNTWNNIGEFWNKTNIDNISEQYINLKNENINNLNNKFSWIHDEDKPFINTDNCKAADWGIPNQVLGNLENAKIIIGLFNPKSHMSNSQANKCLSVNNYIKNELAESKNDYKLETHEFFKKILKIIKTTSFLKIMLYLKNLKIYINYITNQCLF